MPSGAPLGQQQQQDEPTLQEARIAYVNGERQRALAMALSVANAPPAPHRDQEGAWRFIGTAACSLHDVRLATKAYNRLSPADRQLLLSVCQHQGLSYHHDRFQQADPSNQHPEQDPE